MRFLLDTHVVLWLIGAPERVPTPIRDQLADPTNDLNVSAISAFEVATKVRIGKLPEFGLVETWARRVGDIGATELAVSGAHALLAGSMRWAHRDPFDRTLVAQATIESMTLVTVDGAMTELPVPTIVTW